MAFICNRDYLLREGIARIHVQQLAISLDPHRLVLGWAVGMIEACHRAGVTLECIYMYRFMDTALRMKEAVVDG